MPIDQTAVVINACTETVRVVNLLMESIDKLAAIKEQIEGAGIDLADFEAAINAAPAIQHCGPLTFKNIISVFAPNIVAALKADYEGTPTEQGWVAMQKARS